eukprot:m.133700 g.133700  ORF g.133700 m.133700 type:complete len:437 (-) comp14678_c1_seq2:586-1896(-)
MKFLQAGLSSFRHVASRHFCCARNPTFQALPGVVAATNMSHNAAIRTMSSVTEKARIPMPTKLQLQRHMINSSVLFIGIGFMDNIVMIAAADAIDQQLYQLFHFSVLTCAALGQCVSDFAGVTFGIVLERLVDKLSMLKKSGLTHEQLELNQVKVWGAIGSSLGVVVGCLIGASTLLIREQRQLQAEDHVKFDERRMSSVFSSFVQAGHEHIGAEYCNVWLTNDNNVDTLWSRARKYEPPSKEELQKAFAHCDTGGTGFIDAKELLVAIDTLGFQGFGLNDAKQAIAKAIENSESSRRSKRNELNFEQFRFVMTEFLTMENLTVKIRENGIKEKVIRTKECHISNRPMKDPLFNKARSQVGGYKTECVMVCPILDKKTNKPLGVVELANKKDAKGGFTDVDKRLARLMCSNAAVVLEQVNWNSHGKAAKKWPEFMD